MRHESRIRVAFLLLAALFSTTACSADPSGKPVYIPEFVCDEGPIGVRFGNSLKELRAMKGLRSDKHERSQQGSEYRTLTFDGAVMTIVHATGNESRVLIASLTIDKPQPDLTANVGIGTSLAELSAMTGKEIVPFKSQVKICSDTSCVTLVLKDDRVVSMKYECYTG